MVYELKLKRNQARDFEDLIYQIHNLETFNDMLVIKPSQLLNK